MNPLPTQRLNEYREFKVPVSSSCTVHVAKNAYSAPSRLMRYEVTVRLHAERVEIYFAGQRVAEMERLRGQGKARIDYRHVIGSLVRKPGAFENYRYREEMFPSTVFRQRRPWRLSRRIGCHGKSVHCCQLYAKGVSCRELKTSLLLEIRGPARPTSSAASPMNWSSEAMPFSSHPRPCWCRACS